MGYPHPRHPKETPVLSTHFGDAGARTFDGWVQRGGYAALKQALTMTPEAIIEEVKASGLRGRGGAGFPTGLKWSFMPKGDGKPHYLVCNADESEPGTFKDREIMRWTPHQLLEGCAIAAYAIGAERVYIYIRGEFTEPLRVVGAAVEEAYAKGALGANVFGSGKRIDIVVHRGAGAYICGEETAMMNSIEGRRGNPRIKPPLPGAGRPSRCPPPSTTSRRSPWCRTSSTAAPSGTRASACPTRRAPAPSSSRSAGTCSARATTR